MKKILFLMTLLVVGVSFAFAQTNADIKFDKTTHDFGKFSENSPVVSCVFTFTNIGDAPLVIHQAVASCGCTVPEYTKEPIQPGKKGTIKVTYNGTGKYPGHFKKSITLRYNRIFTVSDLNIHTELIRIQNIIIKSNPVKIDLFIRDIEPVFFRILRFFIKSKIEHQYFIVRKSGLKLMHLFFIK